MGSLIAWIPSALCFKSTTGRPGAIWPLFFTFPMFLILTGLRHESWERMPKRRVKVPKMPVSTVKQYKDNTAVLCSMNDVVYIYIYKTYIFTQYAHFIPLKTITSKAKHLNKSTSFQRLILPQGQNLRSFVSSCWCEPTVLVPSSSISSARSLLIGACNRVFSIQNECLTKAFALWSQHHWTCWRYYSAVNEGFRKGKCRLIQLADITFPRQMPVWTQIIAFNKMNMSKKQKNTMKT